MEAIQKANQTSLDELQKTAGGISLFFDEQNYSSAEKFIILDTLRRFLLAEEIRSFIDNTRLSLQAHDDSASDGLDEPGA